MNMRMFRLIGVLLLAATSSLAWSMMPATDTVKGGKDHPLLSRFEGAKLVGYDVKQFDETMLPAGKHYITKDGLAAHDKTVQLEGKVTRIAYNFPRERSSLEVLRNYQSALERAGLKTLFTCAKDACGQKFGVFWYERRLSDGFVQGSGTYAPFIDGRSDMRFLLAGGTRPDGSALHVGVFVFAPVKNQDGGLYLEIVEGKPMETGKVTANLNAAEMAKGIVNEGRVAVYGVYFDTGKAELKPDSKPALAEMAKMLQQEPKMKVFVVGHTDNQGVPAQNLALSQQRADAVVKALAEGYKIDPKRLSAKGMAAYAPLASNRAEDGRQKNRRVELVEQ